MQILTRYNSFTHRGKLFGSCDFGAARKTGSEVHQYNAMNAFINIQNVDIVQVSCLRKTRLKRKISVKKHK